MPESRHELGDGLQLEPVALEAPILDRLWQLYTHDLSESRDTLPNEDGLFESKHLAHYRASPGDWRAFLLSYQGRPAGFAIIGDKWQSDRWTVGDFFVARGIRRQGAGRAVACALLGARPGRWEIAFQDRNPGAPEFWRGVVRSLVGDSYREELRPVPKKPHIPPDRWLLFEIAPETADATARLRDQ
jgi:predicted acetyltransferase